MYRARPWLVQIRHEASICWVPPMKRRIVGQGGGGDERAEEERYNIVPWQFEYAKRHERDI